MIILVAGGAGFIGCHLSKRLLDEGHGVICLDDYSSGTKKNVEELSKYSNEFASIDWDIIKPIDIEVDFIINLACPASPPFYQKDPIQTLKSNVFGASNLLDLAEKQNIPILQASTSEIYGDPLNHPQKEDYWGNVNPIGPRSCYDEGKRAAETLFMDYHRQYGVNTKIVRIFNTFGPKMRSDDGRVVSNFICKALDGEDLEIYGDGTQTRSFCYVDDLIDAIFKLMFIDFHEPVNVGNPQEININCLASTIIELVGSNSKLIIKPLPQDDPWKRKPDISKLKSLIDWEPKVELFDGLRRVIEYFRLNR